VRPCQGGKVDDNSVPMFAHYLLWFMHVHARFRREKYRMTWREPWEEKKTGRFLEALSAYRWASQTPNELCSWADAAASRGDAGAMAQ
jgi:hypothetical protein